MYADPKTETMELVSVIVPVYNEGDNIHACLRGLWQVLKNQPHEILICYDFDDDTTLEAVEKMPDKPDTLRWIRNDLGPGPALAMQAGFRAARGDVVITFMADLSDAPEIIPAMVEKIRHRGCAVVSGSRYMQGGAQSGGPFLKSTLSRLAGLSLFWLAGLKTHDATTNSRAYSRVFLDRVRMETKTGFMLALELTVKAHLLGYKIGEVPSVWRDRTAGESRFFLARSLFGYLYWYARAMGAACFMGGVLVLVSIFALSSEWGPDLGIPGVRIGSAIGMIVVVRIIRGRLRWFDAIMVLVWFLPSTGGAVAGLICSIGYIIWVVRKRPRIEPDGSDIWL